MPAFLSVFLQILPYLPTIIKAVEDMMGPGNGSTKLATATSLISVLAPEIIPHVTSDPVKADVMNRVIGALVAGQKATAPTTAAPLAAAPAGG